MNIDPKSMIVRGDIADSPLVREFRELAEKTGQDIRLGGLTPKKELYGTYRIRLHRYLDGEGPECEGLHDFVTKLSGPGSVDFVELEAETKTYLGAFDEEGALISVTTVGRFDRKPGAR